MARFVAMVRMEFEGDAAWAQGMAEWVVDATKALAQQASVVDPDGPGERVPYAASFEVDAVTDELSLTKAWHTDGGGVVRDGLPVADEEPPPPAEEFPAWAPGVAVLVDAIYSYQGTNYRVVQAHTTQLGWEPPNVPALWQPV